MKTTIVVILAIVALSCSSRDCDDITNQYLEVKSIHDQKVIESQMLFEKLESIPIDSIQDHALIEDELMIVMVDIAIIEIEMEGWKKQYARCLTEY